MLVFKANKDYKNDKESLSLGQKNLPSRYISNLKFICMLIMKCHKV